jgi:hypothetical protein
MFLAFLANIRLGWKGLPRTNTLAYDELINYGHKKFYKIGPRMEKTTKNVVLNWPRGYVITLLNCNLFQT